MKIQKWKEIFGQWWEPTEFPFRKYFAFKDYRIFRYVEFNPIVHIVIFRYTYKTIWRFRNEKKYSDSDENQPLFWSFVLMFNFAQDIYIYIYIYIYTYVCLDKDIYIYTHIHIHT